MKKIIALVLAVVLSLGALSVFAADIAINTVAAKTVTYDTTAAGYSGLTHTLSATGDRVLTIPETDFTDGTDTIAGLDLTTTTVTSVTGAKSVKVATSGTDLVVTFPVYTGTSENAQTLKASFYLKDATGRSGKLSVEYKYKEVATTLVDDDSQSVSYGEVYKMDEAGKVELAFGTDVEIQVKKIAKNAKFNTTYTTTVPAALEEAYPWNAIEYFAVTGSTSVFGAWQLKFLEQEDGMFVYTYADGKLAKLPEGSVKFDKNEEAYLVTGTGTVPAIVISGTELKVDAVTAPTSSVANPGTGSSDMIGVAVVMAVVSLGAAGAVAFKKASK